MENAKGVLDGLRIASPCSQRWEEMSGGDTVRFCGACSLNVYNLSGMGRSEAEALVRGREGRLCVRYYQRQDGTVLTQDCPVGLAAARARLSRLVSIVAGVLAAFVGGVGHLRGGRLFYSPPAPVHDPAMGRVLMGKPAAHPTPMMGAPVMGDVAAH